MSLPYSPVFAQIHAGALECPACGTLHLFGKKVYPHNKCYHGASHTLRCRQCDTQWQIGMLIWPVGPGKRRIAPPTTIAKRKTLLALRNLAGGFWAHVGRGNTEPASLYISGYCLCSVDPKQCPVHQGKE